MNLNAVSFGLIRGPSTSYFSVPRSVFITLGRSTFYLWAYFFSALGKGRSRHLEIYGASDIVECDDVVELADKILTLGSTPIPILELCAEVARGDIFSVYRGMFVLWYIFLFRAPFLSVAQSRPIL